MQIASALDHFEGFSFENDIIGASWNGGILAQLELSKRRGAIPLLRCRLLFM